jgi:histidyl-tRNA synthetase
MAAIQGAPISDNLREIVDASLNLGVPEDVIEYNPTLARGLDYYTGMIFEVFVPEYPVGSFAGGGRYDQLIEQLGGPSIPATGIAFGFDRMVEGAIQLGLIPINESITQALVTVFDEETQKYSLKIASQLRQAGIRTEVYPELDRLGKQLKTADQKKIPYVVIVGPDEAKQGMATVRDMRTGEQLTPMMEEVGELIRGKLAN